MDLDRLWYKFSILSQNEAQQFQDNNGSLFSPLRSREWMSESDYVILITV